MRRYLIAALVCFGLASVAAVASCDGLELGMAVASGADMATTEIFLRGDYGLREGNSFAPASVEGRVAVKVAGTAALIVLYRHVKKRDKTAAKVLAVVSIVAFSLAAGWNIHQMRRD